MNGSVTTAMAMATPEDVGVTRGTAGHRLVVREVRAETADACSVVLEVPEELAERFQYAPGQFLTVRVPGADGARSTARCYSLASAPGLDEHLTVTVKRVAGGTASNWICDRLTAGHELEVLPPAGRFTPRSLDDDVLLFAGGSGITPMMSITRSVLERGSGSVALVYANRDERSVIFGDWLRELAERFPDRLLVLHLLETVEGVPTPARLRTIAAPFADRDAAFVCGPAPFLDAVTTALAAAGVPRQKVIVERFRSLSTDPFAPGQPDTAALGADTGTGAARLTVTLDGERRELAWPRARTLLDLLRTAGMDAPFSCREGACSACACRVTGGEVRMTRNDVLEAEDLDDGWVLACQSHPVTDEVEVSYDD